MSIRVRSGQPTRLTPQEPMMEMLSQNQVAGELGVSLSTVIRLRKDRALPWHKVRGQVRISRDAVRGYLESVVAPATSAAE